MNQNLVNFVLTFTTPNMEHCEGVCQLIKDKLTLSTLVESELSERTAASGEYTYCIGVMEYNVLTDSVLETMNQVDFIKSGYASDLVPNFCSDITLNMDLEQLENELNFQVSNYLVNKSQEQSKEILDLSDRLLEAEELIVDLNDRMKEMESKYTSMYMYIHSFLNLTNMGRILYDVVDIVDPSLKDKYEEIVTLQ